MRLLLQHGADAKIQDKHGKTALDCAQGLRRPTPCSFLNSFAIRWTTFVTYSNVMTVDTFMCIEHAHSDDHVICAALLARHGERAMVSKEDGHEEL